LLTQIPKCDPLPDNITLKKTRTTIGDKLEISCTNKECKKKTRDLEDQRDADIGIMRMTIQKRNHIAK
jgi:hypothetical protein